MQQVIVDGFGAPDVLRVETVPTPQPGAGQVRIAVTSIGMNHADLMARAGRYRLLSGDPPFTPGLEAGGVIDALGPDVADRAVGQRVVLGPAAARASGVKGTYRSHLVCRALDAWPAPAALPDGQLGAAWLSYLTAWGCLVWKQHVRRGQTVALPAASSSVALAAAQIVRRLGGVSIGLTRTQAKADRVRRLPTCAYDHLVVTGDRDWRQDLRRLAPDGIDVFLDPVAAGAYLNTEIRSLAQGGTIWVFGLLADPDRVDVTPLIRKAAAIRGWALSELVGAGADAFEPGCRHVLDGLGDGTYRQHVDRTFALEDAQAAHAWMERGEHVGKLVLVP